MSISTSIKLVKLKDKIVSYDIARSKSNALNMRRSITYLESILELQHYSGGYKVVKNIVK